MKRRIITIDHDLCNGCGLCAQACHEGAIIMEEDKARLLREDYCDGLGDCLPACPAGAISFEEREALPTITLLCKWPWPPKNALCLPFQPGQDLCPSASG